MKSIVKFGGWVVGVVIMVLDLVAYLGMPWTPDLSNPRDKWALFCLSIVTFAACFAAGWYQRGQKDMDEIQPLNDQLAGKQAALENEKRKNAELARRWEELNSEERRRREVFDALNEREKWCLSHIVDDWPKKHSVSGSLLLPSYGVLVRAGILVDQGTEELNGRTVHVYTIALEWRKWVFDHADELPEPNLTLPT